MSKRFRVIGIGLGHPGHLTLDAVRALGTVDVFLVWREDESRTGLAAARDRILDELLPAAHAHRVVEVTHPTGRAGREGNPAAYGPWGGWRVDACAEVLATLAPHEATIGFPVWGDPTLSDETIGVVAALAERFEAEVDVVPGVGAPQLLAARHGISLNPTGGPVHLTSGPRIVAEYDPALGDVVVLLDDRLRCLELAPLHPDLQIYWGAHLGTTDEVLVSGRLADVVDELRAARARAHEARGWVVDAYLLRPAGESREPAPTAWPAVEALTDGVVTLRPVTPDDWPHLQAEHNDPDSIRWAFTTDRMTDAGARRAAARALRDWATGRAARFVVVDAGSGRSAGQISVIRMGPPEVGVIGYGMLPEFRGRGYTTRALELLVDWVFETTSIGRLELGHKIDNGASGVVAARAGFVREGVLAGRLRNADGTFSDEVSYARLRP